jgi:Fic family protein
MNYKPPCTITDKIIDLISKISEQLGRLAVLEDEKHLKLRRINRIRTIQGSLAIEGNTLSEDQGSLEKAAAQAEIDKAVHCRTGSLEILVFCL